MASQAKAMIMNPTRKESGRDASHERVEQTQIIAALAHEYWQRRGCPIGSPEVDWCKAEDEFKCWLEAEEATNRTEANQEPGVTAIR